MAGCIHGAQTLDGFAEQTGCRSGLRFTSLDAGTVLHVQTRRSRYRLVVTETLEHGPHHWGRNLSRARRGASRGRNSYGHRRHREDRMDRRCTPFWYAARREIA